MKREKVPQVAETQLRECQGPVLDEGQTNAAELACASPQRKIIPLLASTL
jgi:hypothetical protein